MPEVLWLRVNGIRHEPPLSAATPLLPYLRNDLRLNGPKYGCGLGSCGACTVLVDDVAARACVLTLADVAGRSVVTLEGLGDIEAPDPVQAAFIAASGGQCGYCLSGMVMTVKALLLQNPSPSDDDVREALRYNLCRCGAHLEILAAARLAAGMSPDTGGDA
ncbi:Nicotinate dehydrogenase subunit A [Hartmannibacter diazotrophicus]|uniref:Nicotinate dehydrogenase subunit A n=1 Tax=Hartmannibacter diazotrophicus TaxID=1482074 RepID=A0A2C9DCM0_9HYPH|nr:(2Fe-2S)-binding protein [Hartmannibacter diazotrophicus]SON57983.1 Nicotinate dehydrogenase subunit A [Hartmannibacter diazotrophicus]